MNSNRNDGHSCVCTDDPSGDKNVLITRCANGGTQAGVQVNAVIHMHFDCIRQTSSQTRQAGFDVTDHPVPPFPSYIPPVLPRSLVYRAFPAELKYSIPPVARLQARLRRKNALRSACAFSEGEIPMESLDAPRVSTIKNIKRVKEN